MAERRGARAARQCSARRGRRGRAHGALSFTGDRIVHTVQDDMFGGLRGARGQRSSVAHTGLREFSSSPRDPQMSFEGRTFGPGLIVMVCCAPGVGTGG